MVWGAIGHNYKSPLVIIDGGVTAAVYQRDMLPHIDKALRRRKAARRFMHDGAKPHSARTTTRWLEGKGIRTLAWPAHSPHLNPIEKFWNTLHQKVAKLEPQSTEDLKEKVLAVWDAITFKEINSYLPIFDKGIPRTIALKGAPW